MLIFTLLVIYQLKHFVCDYPLQTPYMLGKMNQTNWFFPLLSHASVHAIFTLAIVLVFTQALMLAIAIALYDLITHFVIDRIKANPNLGGRFKIDQPQFWWTLGADQMAHHLVHYSIIALLLFYINF